MLSGPETTRILHQFEGQYLLESQESVDRPNHEMGLSAQKAFKKQANNLADVVRRMGNPFLEHFPGLVALDSREQVSKTQYQEYRKEVIKDRTISINSPIKRKSSPFSVNNPPAPNRTSRRQSRYFRTTLPFLLSCTLQYRTVMLTLENSSVTKYSHFLHHCPNLEIFISQVTSLSF